MSGEVKLMPCDLRETAEWADSIADQPHMAQVRGDLIRLATKCRAMIRSRQRITP
jgi:hypothetical protein